ncbi:hypothetical protein ZWY2020_041834 [Hordeum vulgare]|nr:hypothetical protein ZWY2020_041834 [Hordeum vulgare]
MEEAKRLQWRKRSGFTPVAPARVVPPAAAPPPRPRRRRPPLRRAPPRLLSPLRHSPRPPPPRARVLAQPAPHPLLLPRPPPPPPHPSLLHLPPLLTPSSFAPSALPAHALLVKSGHSASGDPFLGSALVSFYARNRLLGDARRVLKEMPRRDTAVCNALLSAYARADLLDATEKLFGEMPDRNVVSWTAMVSGYAQNGRHEEAVGAFWRCGRGQGCSRMS